MKIIQSKFILRGSLLAVLAACAAPVFLARAQFGQNGPADPPAAAPQGAHELFKVGFVQAREGEKLAAAKDFAGALKSYQAAADTLANVQKLYPTWQTEIVLFRTAQVKKELLQVQAMLAINAAAPATPPPPAIPAPRANPVPPPGDPFVRDGKPAAVVEVNLQPRSMLYGLLEYIEVPRDRWLDYTGAHPTPTDATVLRAEVQHWIGDGQARSVELTCVPTISGNRMVVDSQIERSVAKRFGPAAPVPIPLEFETKLSHFTFEWESTVNQDGNSVESNIAPRLVYFCGSDFPNPAERERAQPGDLGQPRLVTNLSTMSMTSAANQPALLSVTTPPDEEGKPRDNLRVLAFFRTAKVALRPAVKNSASAILDYQFGGQPAQITKPAYEQLLKASEPSAKSRLAAIQAALKEGNDFYGRSLILELERVEVTLADLNGWFAGKPLAEATEGLRSAAETWARAGRGRVVDRFNGPARSGQRIAWDGTAGVVRASAYSYEGALPEDPKLPSLNTMQVRTLDDFVKVASLRTPRVATVLPKNPLVYPVDFETSRVGYTVEIEPTVGLGGDVDINVALADRRACGTAVLHRREMNGQLVPDVEQPIFSTMRVQTNVTIPLGVPSLLSIGTPATGDGKPEPQKRILTFVTIRN